MQNKKSKVLVVALIVSLVAIISLGSLAWFTAKDDVTNTLKFADDFNVQVYEHDWSKPNTDETTEDLTYTGIMPGQTILKDPTVRNNGTHSEWVRVTVTANHLKELQELFPVASFFGDVKKHVQGFDSTKWSVPASPTNLYKFDKTAGTVTFTLYLTNKLEPNGTATLFNKIIIPEELTSEQAAAMAEDPFTIKVEAEAMQAENLPNNVTTAQQAFALLEKK